MDDRTGTDSARYDARVIENFVDAAGRLDGIPAQRKKRLAVLRWLVENFQPGRRYSEGEVNQIISRRYPDFATLRRHLVDEELIQRKSSIYWRTGSLPNLGHDPSSWPPKWLRSRHGAGRRLPRRPCSSPPAGLKQPAWHIPPPTCTPNRQRRLADFRPPDTDGPAAPWRPRNSSPCRPTKGRGATRLRCGRTRRRHSTPGLPSLIASWRASSSCRIKGAGSIQGRTRLVWADRTACGWSQESCGQRRTVGRFRGPDAPTPLL